MSYRPDYEPEIDDHESEHDLYMDDMAPAPRNGATDPIFGYVLAVAVAVGLAPLVGAGDPSLRYTLVWGLLALFGVIAVLLGGMEPIAEEKPENLVWGLVFGLIIGIPTMLLGAGLLGGAARRMFGFMEPGGLLAYLIFVMPLAETLYFRGILYRSRPPWAVALMAAGWSLVVFSPHLDITNFPLVALAIMIAFVLLNVLYGYVRQRNGLAAAWICQIVANIAVLFLPFLIG
jgi:hypothetical protein